MFIILCSPIEIVWRSSGFIIKNIFSFFMIAFLPPPKIKIIYNWCVLMEMAFNIKKNNKRLKALKKVFGLNKTKTEYMDILKKNIFIIEKNKIDSFYVFSKKKETIRQLLDQYSFEISGLQNFENLKNLLKAGRPIIFVSLHYGPFTMGSFLLINN